MRGAAKCNSPCRCCENTFPNTALKTLDLYQNLGHGSLTTDSTNNKERTRMVTRVGIVSDTHGVLSRELLRALEGCDFIIHAGDIGDASILKRLETVAPVTAVLGNNDYDLFAPDVRKPAMRKPAAQHPAAQHPAVRRYAHPVIDGVRFLVAHRPNEVRLAGGRMGDLAPGDPLPDVCVHGHTHIPEIKTRGEAAPAKLIVCPGSASFPRGGYPETIAMLETEEGHVLAARIETLYGDVLFGMDD